MTYSVASRTHARKRAFKDCYGPAMRSKTIAGGWDPDPSLSMSLQADAYTLPEWFETDQQQIISRSWQWLCHGEKLRNPGNYVADEVAGMPIVAVRDVSGELRAFFNVCQHRAHHVLAGEGTTSNIVCPYHGWSYDLGGTLQSARHTKNLVDFEVSSICLDQVQVEELGGFVYVNLDPTAPPLAQASGQLAEEIAHWAPDVEQLTFAHRLKYTINSNWKNVVDNFLECYHCHVAHKDFVSLVDMDTYKGHDARHLLKPHGPGRQDREQRVRRVRGDGHRPRRLVGLAQHLHHALPRAREYEHSQDHPGIRERHVPDLRFLP